MKTLVDIIHNRAGHWVGDGFPVRSLFSHQGDTKAISPFLLFDYAGPYMFEPNEGSPRGVGEHPHRGFETVTIVYDGEVSHRDSTGGGGTISKGDVQWMTAGGGIIHGEFHSPGFSKAGGPFRMVQLWVNLPAKDKGRRLPTRQSPPIRSRPSCSTAEERGSSRGLSVTRKARREPLRPSTCGTCDLTPVRRRPFRCPRAITARSRYFRVT